MNPSSGRSKPYTFVENEGGRRELLVPPFYYNTLKRIAFGEQLVSILPDLESEANFSGNNFCLANPETYPSTILWTLLGIYKFLLLLWADVGDTDNIWLRHSVDTLQPLKLKKLVNALALFFSYNQLVLFVRRNLHMLNLTETESDSLLLYMSGKRTSEIGVELRLTLESVRNCLSNARKNFVEKGLDPQVVCSALGYEPCLLAIIKQIQLGDYQYNITETDVEYILSH